MPERPDIVVYVEAPQKPILNQPLQRVGKRIAIGLEDELWLLIHLMILDDFTGGSRVSV